jgi:hypothetical protein
MVIVGAPFEGGNRCAVTVGAAPSGRVSRRSPGSKARVACALPVEHRTKDVCSPYSSRNRLLLIVGRRLQHPPPRDPASYRRAAGSLNAISLSERPENP